MGMGMGMTMKTARGRVLATVAAAGIAIASMATGASAATARPALGVQYITPPAIAVGTQHASLGVVGHGFVDGTVAELTGTGAVVTATELITGDVLRIFVRVPPTAPLGSRTLIIHNPDGTNHRCQACIAIDPQPTSTDAFPASVGQGARGALMLVHGTNFDQYARADIGDGVRVYSTGSANPNSVVLAVNVDRDAPTGTRDIAIVNANYGHTICVACLTVDPGPTVANVSPASLDAGSDGAPITITGSGFQSGLNVQFSISSVRVESIDVVSSTELTVTVNISATARNNTANLTITNPDHGMIRVKNAFTVT